VTKNANIAPEPSPQAAGEQPLLRKSGWTGKVLAAIGALVSLMYLANLGAGIFEFAPDNLPGVGNIDEVLFTFLLLFCLQKLGIDLLPHLRKRHAND
jgi:hypothetical protein